MGSVLSDLDRPALPNPIDTPDRLAGTNHGAGVPHPAQQRVVEDTARQAHGREGQGGFRGPLAVDQADAVDRRGAQGHRIDAEGSECAGSRPR